MGGGGSQPKPIDPNLLIREQERVNRVNTYGPFGSQVYGTGPDGRTSFTTSLSPQMQAIVDRTFEGASKDSARYEMPSDMREIMAKLMSRYRGRLEESP